MKKHKHRKHIKTINTVIESCLLIILIVLVAIMMVLIGKLQGTARVINYTGLVRGATQREVKLEITGNPNDELIDYLDGILEDLKYEDGDYNLVKLDDNDYEKKLDTQIAFWILLKNEIYKVREYGYENTDIVNLSEEYFQLADQTVSAAEKYSERIACNIRLFETFTAIDMIIIIIFIINMIVYFIGEENIANFLQANPVLAPVLASLIGLLPNCASSVILTQLYVQNVIPVSTMIAGLLVGAGVGLAVLFKMNKKLKENIEIVVLLVVIGTLSGIILQMLGINF